jgi:hypothetical protein
MNMDDNGIVTITILGIVHYPVFYLKYNISETGFCLLHVESTHAQYIELVTVSGH